MLFLLTDADLEEVVEETGEEVLEEEILKELVVAEEEVHRLQRVARGDRFRVK